jgi:hypothetical protein
MLWLRDAAEKQAVAEMRGAPAAVAVAVVESAQ